MTEDTAPELAALAERLRERFPRFRLIAKESSPLMRVLQVIVRLWNPRFLDTYTTAIGYRIYMPQAVRTDPRRGVAVLRHEAVHVEQFRRHPIWYPLSYLLLLPAGITMRARWEFEAYVESMRVELEETGDIADATLDTIERAFTGPEYLYMDVRRASVRRRLEAARARLLAQAA